MCKLKRSCTPQKCGIIELVNATSKSHFFILEKIMNKTRVKKTSPAKKQKFYLPTYDTVVEATTQEEAINKVKENKK